jgi:uncharacterized membrane protein (UPF0127 family)
MIKNITRKTTISNKVRFCNNIFSKGIGLMFSRKTDKSLVFSYNKELRISLHMLFVFYPIDVIFVDGKSRVVDLKENFRPFAFYMPKRKAQFVIEMPQGTIKNTKTRIGDSISIK